MCRIALSLLLCLMMAPFASASEETNLRFGAITLINPEYVGSDDYDIRALPFISFDDIAGFELSGLALTYPLIDIGTGQGPGTWAIKAGPRAAFDFGRDSADSPTLAGLEDIDASLLAGGFLRASYGVLGLRLDAGQDIIGGHEGFIADLSLGTFLPKGLIAEKLSVQPGLSISWADKTYNQAIYGITAQQAAASTQAQYDLGSGFHRASLNLLGWYEIDDRWQLNSVISYRKYLGDYAGSPILQAPDGATSDVFALIGISRRFGR